MSSVEIRECLKKLRFIYSPYSKLKTNYVLRKRLVAVHTMGYLYASKICKALEENCIDSFCAFGTLLGVVRDNGFIKNDTDLDFGIVSDDSFKWDKLESTLNNIGLIKDHQYVENDIIIEQTYRYKFLYVDFFLYFETDDQLVAHVCYKDDNLLYPKKDQYSIMLRYSPRISSFQNIEVNNYELRIPSNYQEYLVAVYGSNWRIPDDSYDYRNEIHPLKGVFATVESF